MDEKSFTEKWIESHNPKPVEVKVGFDSSVLVTISILIAITAAAVVSAFYFWRKTR